MIGRNYEISINEAMKLYDEHKEKPFFDGTVKHMSWGESNIMVLERINGISALRKMMGSTNPEDAEPGTIRGDFGCQHEDGDTAIHGSSDSNSAKEEIDMFFPDLKI